ncbi:MAG: NUDIX domain-containing protein [Planctomycetota bacterium]
MSEASERIIDRHAARVLLLDRHDRVLLLRCQEPGSDRAFWITPGGGLDEGETYEQAAARELYEETGMSGVELGPCVWTRTHTFPWLGKQYRQHERFFLLQVEQHVVDTTAHTEEEKLALTAYHWWSAEEIARAKDQSFAPRQLGRWLQCVLEEGPPSQPIDVGA